ncbi:MAG TPA: winged helix-turn-helix domain-containing protein [Nitrososphaera sp.]|nr:winged helix-turn-helix domain-containing protein [Nitrososphaera sp.]
MEELRLHTKTVMKNPDQTLRLGQIEEKKTEKRDKLDLLLELLEATNEPTKKTHLIYRLRINYYQLTRYLDLLLKLEMVEEVTKPFEGYTITEKGRIMQRLFNKI